MTNRIIIYKRGQVLLCRFNPPDKQSKTIHKFVLCLQEGNLPQKSKFFTGLNITSIKSGEKVRNYPTEVFLTPEESGTQCGASILCAQIHTYPETSIVEPKYIVPPEKMKIVDAKLLFGIGLRKIDDL